MPLVTDSADALYAGLGVRWVINAAAAMAAAAGAYVDLTELHDRVGERLAALTRNEAACVSCGAAADIQLATAACLAGDDPDSAAALPDTAGLGRDEVIVAGWLAGLAGVAGLPGVRLERDPESHIGQPIPRAVVRLPGTEARDAAVTALWAGEGNGPCVAVLPHGEDGFALNSQGVQASEAGVVLAVVVRVVSDVAENTTVVRVP